MEKKELFETIKNEISVTLTKVFDKVEEVGKVSSMKLKIHGLQAQIKDFKNQIGDIVYQNQDDFKHIPEINVFIERIQAIEKDIDEKNSIIDDLKEKEETPKEKV
jgi:predicted RNase H-like nuclease (RuvC/YqgF family)